MFTSTASRQFVLGITSGLTVACFVVSFSLLHHDIVLTDEVEYYHNEHVNNFFSMSHDRMTPHNDTPNHRDGLGDLCNGPCPYLRIPPQAAIDIVMNKLHADLTKHCLIKEFQNRRAMCRKNTEAKYDDTVARKLEEEIRVLVWIITSPSHLEKKANVVKNTWAGRCNKAIFFSSEDNATFPTVGLLTPDGPEYATAKTMESILYIYEHHIGDADWFMKADDATFVIVENLRYFLSDKNTNEPVCFRHHFKNRVKQGYYSGCGGYVLSKEALRRLGEEAKDSNICSLHNGPEDVELGRCLERLGIRADDSTASLNRSRIHCFRPDNHLSGTYPNWYFHYEAGDARKGPESISDYAISFHYVSPQKMLTLEFFMYRFRLYGFKPRLQDLNKHDKNE